MLQSCTGKLEEARIKLDSCQFDDAESYLNQAIATDLREENLQEVLQIYLNTYTDSIFEFNDDEYFALYNIACQYPLDGGEGVYIARTLLGEDLECEDVRPKALIVEDEDNNNFKEENLYKVYPNPTEGELFIETLQNEGIIKVIDLSGKEVLSKQINSSIETVNLGNLRHGVYFIQMQHNNEIIFNERVVIIK
jgi:hypothetical protein